MLKAIDLYERLKEVTPRYSGCDYTLNKCEEDIVLINEINRLKQQKNAIILAHSYVSPDIIHSVADFVGDSYELSKNARETNANIIVFVAVRFMAETAKVLNPEKEVLIPSRLNGCSLADSIDADQVKNLRQKYPDYAFICYINTTAEVKALCDVTVTSSNVYKIVEDYPNDKIFFLPDKLMGENLKKEMEKRGVRKDIRLHDGTCYVHEEYHPAMIDKIREKHVNVEVLAHPECNQQVAEQCDFVGSTSQMLAHVKQSANDKFFLLTECGLISRIEAERGLEKVNHIEKVNHSKTSAKAGALQGKQMVGACTMCQYMKSNNLSDILRVLTSPQKEDVVDLKKEIMDKARSSILSMFDYA